MSRWSLPDPSTRVDVVPVATESATRTAPQASAAVPRTTSVGAWLLVIGGGLAVVGSILPWSVVTSSNRVLSADGLRGDGRLTFVLGLALMLVGLVALARRLPASAAGCALVVGIAVAVVAGYNAFDLESLGGSSDQLASFELGHGLVITLIGGVVAVVGAARLVARA